MKHFCLFKSKENCFQENLLEKKGYSFQLFTPKQVSSANSAWGPGRLPSQTFYFSLNIKVPPELSCLIRFRITTLPAGCRSRARGEWGDGDEHYLVILSAAIWASALHRSSVFRLSCSVNHGFNIYLTIQYLPRRFATCVTEAIMLLWGSYERLVTWDI